MAVIVLSGLETTLVTGRIFALLFAAYRSDNLIVGQTEYHTPTYLNHVCGQYSGAVPPGVPVNVQCSEELETGRYVVLQFPDTDQMSLCEVEVCALGEDRSVLVLDTDDDDDDDDDDEIITTGMSTRR